MSSIYIHIPDVFDLNLKRKIESAILTEIDLRHNELNEKLIQSIYIKSPKKKLLSSNFLESLISLNGIKFSKNPILKDFYFQVMENLKYERFDGIAGGLQDWLENTLSKWISNIIKFTKNK